MPVELAYLLGDVPALAGAAEPFVEAAGGVNAVIALLLQGGAGWQKYVPRYANPLKEHGARACHVIAPDEGEELDVNAVTSILSEATGILVGGGHTPTYHRLYATEPIRGLIRARYSQGVPYAGISAGAIIALDACVLKPDQTADGSYELVSGLGLVKDVLIEVHFTEGNRLPILLEEMALTRTRKAFGIDEPACALFRNGQFKGALGRSVCEITMLDFESRRHRVNVCAALK